MRNQSQSETSNSIVNRNTPTKRSFNTPETSLNNTNFVSGKDDASLKNRESYPKQIELNQVVRDLKELIEIKLYKQDSQIDELKSQLAI